MIAISLFTFGDAIVGVGMGVIRGVGMQKQGAIICFIGMYLIGGPLGLTLLLVTDLKAKGFWYGMSVGMVFEAIIFFIIILRINWVKMCEKAQKRTKIRFVRKTTSLEKMAEEAGNNTEEGNDKSATSESRNITKEDDDTEVKACTPKIISTRAALIVFGVLTIVIALICRYTINWKSHFQNYCLLANGTLIPITTQFDYGRCKQILP